MMLLFLSFLVTLQHSHACCRRQLYKLDIVFTLSLRSTGSAAHRVVGFRSGIFSVEEVQCLMCALKVPLYLIMLLNVPAHVCTSHACTSHACFATSCSVYRWYRVCVGQNKRRNCRLILDRECLLDVRLVTGPVKASVG